MFNLFIFLFEVVAVLNAPNGIAVITAIALGRVWFIYFNTSNKKAKYDHMGTEETLDPGESKAYNVLGREPEEKEGK